MRCRPAAASTRPGMIADIPNSLPGGSTNMVEGLYRGWDEVRSVPIGSQSGLRVIVLFTDGASNSVPADWDGTGIRKGGQNLRLSAHCQRDADGQTHGPARASRGPITPATRRRRTVLAIARPDLPSMESGLGRNAANGTNPADGSTVPVWAQWMPATSMHTHPSQPGHPDDVPAADQHTEGQRCSAELGSRVCGNSRAGKYPSQIWNINNAARNLVEIIANAARDETKRAAPRPDLHHRHGPAGAAATWARGARRPRASSSASPTTRRPSRTSTPTSSKARTTTPRRRPTWRRRSRRCRIRSSG